MLFEEIYDSVMRHHRKSQSMLEQEGRAISKRLHELLEFPEPGQEKILKSGDVDKHRGVPPEGQE